MGDLYYGAARLRVRIDDRTLTHLRVVITAKLRRNESFALSWRDSRAVGGGRSVVWVHPRCDLHYKFDGGRIAELDRELIEQMTAQAATAGGLELDEASITNR